MEIFFSLILSDSIHKFRSQTYTVHCQSSEGVGRLCGCSQGTSAYPALPSVFGSSAVQVLTSVVRDTPGFIPSSLFPYLHTVQPTVTAPQAHRTLSGLKLYVLL